MEISHGLAIRELSLSRSGAGRCNRNPSSCKEWHPTPNKAFCAARHASDPAGEPPRERGSDLNSRLVAFMVDRDCRFGCRMENRFLEMTSREIQSAIKSTNHQLGVAVWCGANRQIRLSSAQRVPMRSPVAQTSCDHPGACQRDGIDGLLQAESKLLV